MGEIADSMIEGECCSGCNVYFTKTHGYPVLCKDCWEDWTPKERKDFQKATYPEFGDE